MPLSPYDVQLEMGRRNAAALGGLVDPLHAALMGRADSVLDMTRQRQSARRRGRGGLMSVPSAAGPTAAPEAAGPDFDAIYRQMFEENPALVERYSPGPNNWRNSQRGRDAHLALVSDRGQGLRDYRKDFGEEVGTERGALKDWVSQGNLSATHTQQGPMLYDQKPASLVARQERRAQEIAANKDRNLELAVRRGVATPATRALAQQKGLVPQGAANSVDPLLDAIMGDPQIASNPALKAQLYAQALQNRSRSGLTPAEQQNFALKQEELRNDRDKWEATNKLQQEALSSTLAGKTTKPGVPATVAPANPADVMNWTARYDPMGKSREQILGDLADAGINPLDIEEFLQSPEGTHSVTVGGLLGNLFGSDAVGKKARTEKFGRMNAQRIRDAIRRSTSVAKN